jgi:hypothetical protein
MKKHQTDASPEVPDDKLCSICFQKEIKTANISCGHLVYCLECVQLDTKRILICPKCNTPLTQVMEIYM